MSKVVTTPYGEYRIGEYRVEGGKEPTQEEIDKLSNALDEYLKEQQKERV